MPAPTMQVSICRAVVYVNDQGADHAAIVSEVFDDGTVNLHVFNPEPDAVGDVVTVATATYSLTPNPGTWHWPARV